MTETPYGQDDELLPRLVDIARGIAAYGGETGGPAAQPEVAVPRDAGVRADGGLEHAGPDAGPGPDAAADDEEQDAGPMLDGGTEAGEPAAAMAVDARPGVGDAQSVGVVASASAPAPAGQPDADTSGAPAERADRTADAGRPAAAAADTDQGEQRQDVGGATPGPDMSVARPDRTDAGTELADPERLRAAVEAVLLVVDMPTSATGLAQVLGRAVPDVEAALRFLRDEYEAGGRGLDLREVAEGWRLYSREDFAAYVERFVLDGQQARLTQAALETLAVIAYRQPVTRSRIAGIRGVSVDAVMRTLLTRGLVEECGADPDTGGGLYRTTRLFLEKVGLRSLDDLPSLAPLLPDTSQLDDVAVST